MYNEVNDVERKVKSAFFKDEAKEGKLWGVAECSVIGSLNQEEINELKDYISGQASDGWGEGFEQREIEVNDGTLYVSLWSMDQNWFIKTEEELFGDKENKKQPINEIIESAKKRSTDIPETNKNISPPER